MGGQMRQDVPDALGNDKDNRAVNVLMLEDSEQDAELIVSHLKDGGFDVEYRLVQNKEEFREALKEGQFDAVLSDYRLPGWTGVDALAELRDHGLDTPFLLITGTLGEEAAVECIKQGVDDYILKEHLSRLPFSLTRALAEKKLRDEAERAQQALRASESRNRDLVENSAYGIFRVSGNGEFLDANPALLRMIGCDARKNLKNLSFGRDLFRFPEQHARFLGICRETGRVQGAQTEWRRCDGGIVAVRMHMRKVTADRADTFEIIAEDVTELRAMERQLLQAQKFEAVGQLAGGIAHDFNNVIGAILGWAELGLEQNRSNTEVAERFTRIREQAERAASLTRELQAFASRQVLQPRAVDLNSVTSGLVNFLEKVIGKHIELKFLNAALDPVKADPMLIEQAVMNLCLNARDSMPGGGRLVIETEMVELDDSYCRFYPYVTPGRYAVLSVSDTGCGMDAETRERVFEPFFPAKDARNGAGLGLAAVYGIVKQHGGFIHVYSEPGHGSLFRVYLPAMEAENAANRVAKLAAPSVAEMRGTETILIADDHEAVREMARQTLTGLGYRILAARDGEEALQLCQNEAPALAIIDVVMPKVGGPAVAARLGSQFANMKIIITSGYSAEGRGLSEKGGNFRYLQKPYSPTSLGRLVREILNEQTTAEVSGHA